jgi:hypothetical protein
MAEYLSSRRLANRLSLTGGRLDSPHAGVALAPGSQGWLKDAPNPLFAPGSAIPPPAYAVHQKTISVPQRSISDPSGP